MLTFSYWELFSSSRVLPDLTIADLRTDIAAQLDTEVVPANFVFVRGVGRHFTEVSLVFFTNKSAKRWKRQL